FALAGACGSHGFHPQLRGEAETCANPISVELMWLQALGCKGWFLRLMEINQNSSIIVKVFAPSVTPVLLLFSLLSPNHPDPSSFRHFGFKPVRILHLVRLTHNKFSTKLRLSAGSGRIGGCQLPAAGSILTHSWIS
ncbi:unnamed protein product, partial [Urochloa humidicola]